MRTDRRPFNSFLALAGILLVWRAFPLTVERTATESPAQAALRFSEWSEAVNLGPVVNSPSNDFIPEVSSDGLSLYFTSNRPGGMGGADLWVSRRPSPDAPWEEPVNLGSAINTGGNDGFGDNDLWVAWRHRPDDDFAWEPPVNLGSDVNSSSFDAGGWLARPEFYFTSTRLSSPNLDIFLSPVIGNTLGPAMRVEELSSSANDQRPSSPW